jgi:phosphatidylserine/phosphatidylglycerophosphate/cardiolipin synthase-like enzyme
VTAPQLIQGYDAAVEALIAEIDDTQRGDAIDLHVFIVEPAETTERTMNALRAAAGRGVSVELSIDYTLTSHVSRAWEWTPTYFRQARALGREVEGITFKQRALADHSKYGLFRRPQGTDTALLGGINLGDRFRPWQDFMIRLREPAHVEHLRQVLGGSQAAPPVPPPERAVSFAANLPQHGKLHVAPTFQRLLADPGYATFRFAMAYIDRWGARLIHAALDRGARVELILPRRANVYHDANMHYLNRLRARSEHLHAYLCPDMVHAKAMVALDQEGRPTAFVGSCNLKRASLYRLGELNALISEPSFAGALDQALVSLRERSEHVQQTQRYFWVQALFEELLG